MLSNFLTLQNRVYTFKPAIGSGPWPVWSLTIPGIVWDAIMGCLNPRDSQLQCLVQPLALLHVAPTAGVCTRGQQLGNAPWCSSLGLPV